MAMLGFTVIKDGRTVKAGENKIRIFKTRESAWKYVSNLIWCSKSLTKDNFRLMKVHG